MQTKEEGYLFFFHENELNGWCSNWYPAAFTLDGVIYRDTEQYFVAQRQALTIMHGGSI